MGTTPSKIGGNSSVIPCPSGQVKGPNGRCVKGPSGSTCPITHRVGSNGRCIPCPSGKIRGINGKCVKPLAGVTGPNKKMERFADIGGSSGPNGDDGQKEKELLEKQEKEKKRLEDEARAKEKEEKQKLIDKLNSENASQDVILEKQRALNEKQQKEIDKLREDLYNKHQRQLYYYYKRRGRHYKIKPRDASGNKHNISITVNTPKYQTWGEWFANLLNALFGSEGFKNRDEPSTILYPNTIVTIGFIIMALVLLTSLSAARLSYCYNKFIGNSDSESFLWSALCFLFPSYYWAVYPFVFNPLCDLKKNKGLGNFSMFGGKKDSRNNKKTNSVRKTR
jgi:hypothetical protein